MHAREFVRQALKRNPKWSALLGRLRVRAAEALKTAKMWFRAGRTRADRLRPYAARMLESAGNLFHAGIVYTGKFSPRTARALEAFETWLRRSDRRQLGLTALAVFLVLGLGFAALFPQTAERYCRAAFSPGRVAPLPDEIRRAASEKARQLAVTLDSLLDKKAKFGGEVWASAQILVALGETDPRYASRVNTRLIEKHFRSVAGPECACWRRLPQGRYPNNIGITGWVLWALAAYGIPANKGEMEFLLAGQHRDGWWPMFADAKEDPFASTYGTAAAILALHTQSGLKEHEAQRMRIAEAVQRGASWLRGRAVADRARWADYPAWPEARERKESLGVSGFALYALHRVGAPGLAGLDRDWLRNLPMEIPAARRGDASGKPVQVGKRLYPDDTLYYGLPWGILATVLAYPSGWISGKAHAIQWLERALAPGASIHALNGSEGPIAAEALFALRNYPEVARNE